MRVRGFTQDDAHIICTPEQMSDEISETLRFSLFMLRSFGFTEFKAYLSTKPLGGKSVGEDSKWDAATESLRKAIEAEGLEYDVDEGGGAFYGPKIDLKIKDAMGRAWQLSTIQFDFNLPERFKMTFVDHDGQEKQPYVIHRALLGSIEHFGGAFPVWLSPVQVCVIPVAAPFDDYAKKITAELKAAGLRVEADLSDGRLNAKIRNAQKEKIPYMLILGEKEEAEDAVSVRLRTGEQTNGVPFADFLAMINDKIEKQELI
jgi:threonyl-tRNA synthetase